MGNEIFFFPYIDNMGIMDDTMLGIPSYSVAESMENCERKWESLHGTLSFMQKSARGRDEQLSSGMNKA